MGKSATTLDLIGEDKGREHAIEASIDKLIIAGWTGRDLAAMEAHIDELSKLGVPRPKSTPIFYRVATALVTTSAAIQVVGNDTSGEVEPVIVSLDDGLWIGVGSDHTDRKIEAIGITISKQLCAKVISPRLWRYEEIAGHWHDLILRSYAVRGSERRLYQEGHASRLRHPEELMSMYLGPKAALPVGTIMFCGTLPALGPIGPADVFELELEYPLRKRKITHRYDIQVLPVEG